MVLRLTCFLQPISATDLNGEFMTLALAICLPAAYVATRCPSRRTETLMAGLLVLSTAPVIVRWSGAAKPCGPASSPMGYSAAVVRRHE